MPLKIVFCGTPAFAVPTLLHLIAQPDFEVVGVVTQPDRPRGRGGEISMPAVKSAAIQAGIPVYQPEKIKTDEGLHYFERIRPDAVVIIAYGQIISARLISVPRLGWINLHGSLLPKYRGAAPVNWAIVNGETETGLTTMQIDPGLDTGPMGGFDNAKVDELFLKGTSWKSNFLCNIGYGDASKLFLRGPRLNFEEACKIA